MNTLDFGLIEENLRQKLPSKLSDAVIMAVDDLVKVERSKLYEVNMMSWHYAGLPGRACQVCLAGAVLAKEGGVPPEKSVELDEFTEDTILAKIEALDYIREGDVLRALNQYYDYDYPIYPDDDPEKLDAIYDLDDKYRLMPSYDENPGKFKRTLRKLARDLAELGL